MPETADQPPTNEQPLIAPNRVQALLGITGALAVAAGLGFPGLDVGTTIQVLLVVIGFRIARVAHRCMSQDDWRIPLVLGLAGRAVPTVLLVVALVALYRSLTNGFADGEVMALVGAATFTANIIPFATDASFAGVEHFWAVALVAQITIAAPWLLTVKRQRLQPRRRATLLFAAAALAGIGRMIFLAASVVTSSGTDGWLAAPEPSLAGAIAVWTSVDALFIGLGLGTLPLAALHRHPTTKLVMAAVAGLAVLLVAPPIGPAVIDVGLRLTLAAVFTGVVLSAEAIASLPGWLSRALTNAWWHRLGSRTFGLYLWHIPFAYGVTGRDPYDWHGLFVFTIVLALTLAAATTTYRSIEIPALLMVARVASRWYRPDSILLPRAEPQLGKWVRWDEISLDNLPVPHRRRPRRSETGTETRTAAQAEEPLGRRLWQLGDRGIDLRAGRRARPDERDESDQVGPSAATG